MTRYNSGRWLASKTVAGFWPLVADVATPRQTALLAAHLGNPATFGARNGVPSLSMDDPNYREDGGYWRGSVWPPALYAVVVGLREQGYRKLAHDLAVKHLDHMLEVYRTRKPMTIWECYSPEQPTEAMKEEGVPVRPYFVGWGGLGPIVMLVEDVLGLDINALDGEIVWHLSELGRQGLKDFVFNGGRVSLTAEVLSRTAFRVDVKTDRPFRLTVISPDGECVVTRDVEPGTCAFKSSGLVGRKVGK